MSLLFKNEIEKILGKGVTPKQQYTISPGTGRIIINNLDDKANFKKLFNVTSGQGTGFGEIALFWLFNGNGSKAESTAGRNNPDLRINGSNAEVKSYNQGLDHTFTLGRFQAQIDFREMISIIFGISNLSSSGVLKNSSKGASQKFIDVLNFNYRDLVDAADKFCDLRSALHILKEDKIGKRAFELLPFLDNVISNCEKFDRIAKSNNLSTICGIGADKPGGKLIGAELTKFLLKNLLGTKPGDQGYFINGAKKGNDIEMTYIQVNLNKINDRPINLLEKGFSANGGQININLKHLFG